MKIDPELTNSRPEFNETKTKQNEVKINKYSLKYKVTII